MIIYIVFFYNIDCVKAALLIKQENIVSKEPKLHFFH